MHFIFRASERTAHVYRIKCVECSFLAPSQLVMNKIKRRKVKLTYLWVRYFSWAAFSIYWNPMWMINDEIFFRATDSTRINENNKQSNRKFIRKHVSVTLCSISKLIWNISWERALPMAITNNKSTTYSGLWWWQEWRTEKILLDFVQ